MEDEILRKIKAGQSRAAAGRARDELGRFFKSNIKVSQTSINNNLISQNQADALVDIRLNNPLSALFKAALKSLHDGIKISIKLPSPLAILFGALIFGIGGFFFGRQTIDITNLFIGKNGQALDPNQYVNKNVIVTGKLNPDKKTFSVFSINTVGP